MPRSVLRLLVAAVIGLIAPAWDASASGSDQFQINTYTTGNQFSPSVAFDEDDDFVVVWISFGSSGTDFDGFSIQGQRYESTGSLAGSEFQINTYTTGSDYLPAVSLDSDGDFIVVWQSTGTGNIHGQRFASSGMPEGDEFAVNAYTTSTQQYPSMAMDPSGDFVVAWESLGSSSSDSSSKSIQAQRFASDGTRAGSQFQVNTYTFGDQRFAWVSRDEAGDFVVVWASSGSQGTDSSGYSVQAQRYSSDGALRGGEFQVNSYTTGNQLDPRASADADGDFVIVWESMGSAGTDSSMKSVQGQRFASDGSRLGGEFQVNSYTTGRQFGPEVSVKGDGDFVIVWVSDGSSTDMSGHSVWGQLYASSGLSLSSEFQVNTYTTGIQLNSAVAFDADGDCFAVVWHSYGSGGTDTDDPSIQGRFFINPLFADDFESGDVTGWPIAVP